MTRRFNTIDLRSGVEGPRHDPYGWQEVTVRGRAGVVTYHAGLATWTKLVRESGEAEVTHTFNGRDEAALRFERLVGVTPETAREAKDRVEVRRIASHLRTCGSDLICVSGHPGESLECCRRCGQPLRSHFDRSAVE